MKETKVKDRTENVGDPFFEYRQPFEDAPLQSFVDRKKPSKPESDAAAAAFVETGVPGFLRQALLFFPGTFLLFFLSMGGAIALPNILTYHYDGILWTKGFYVFFAVAAIASLMTWLGLGDIKNKKHSVIPASIIASGALIGLTVAMTDGLIWFARQVINDFAYAVYFFPVGLIVPFLAKGWIDSRKSAEDSKPSEN